MKVDKSDITLIKGLLFGILSQGTGIYVFKFSFALVAIVFIIISIIEGLKETK